jgi:hypothetical protein
MDAKSKRLYQKPVIERIDLVGEEVAAVPNCKRATGGGKNQTFPNPCDTKSVAKCRDSLGS